MRLNQLSDNPGARYKSKRVGRGIGSGKGVRAGRGQKGQKSRSGVAINGFEGGQMPLHMRLPKRGFNSRNRKSYIVINIGRLQKAIDDGKLDAKGDIDSAKLLEAGVINRTKDGVRLLAKGEIKSKISIKVDGASKAAIEAIEKAGGKVNIAETPKASSEAAD